MFEAREDNQEQYDETQRQVVVRLRTKSPLVLEGTQVDRQVGDLAGTGGTTSDAEQIVREEGDDLAEAQSHNRQVVTAQSQGRNAQQHTEQHREHDGEGDRVERVENNVERGRCRESASDPCRRIGPDGVEGDVPEVK